MDFDGVRSPPKPSFHVPTALYTSPLLDLTPEKKAIGLKQNKERHFPLVSSENDAGEGKEIHACLAQPSMNSTKRVNKKLLALEEEQFNPAEAIAKKLEQSEITRSNLCEKVAQAVNVKKGGNIYSDLVSLNVDAEDAFAEHAHVRARSSAKTYKPPLQEPDIMAFFSEEFETQSAHFGYDLFYVEEPLPEPSAAPISHVFDLYKHVKSWQEQ